MFLQYFLLTERQVVDIIHFFPFEIVLGVQTIQEACQLFIVQSVGS